MWVPYEFFQLPSRRITTLRTWRVQLRNNESHFNLLWSMKTLKLPTHMAFSVLIEMLCHCARDFHLANTVSADDWSRLCGNILFSQRTALHGAQIYNRSSTRFPGLNLRPGHGMLAVLHAVNTTRENGKVQRAPRLSTIKRLRINLELWIVAN